MLPATASRSVYRCARRIALSAALVLPGLAFAQAAAPASPGASGSTAAKSDKPAAPAVYRCVRPDGKVEFTDVPCQNTGAKGSALDVRPAVPADAKAAAEARERAQRESDRARAAGSAPAPAAPAAPAASAPSGSAAKGPAIPDDASLIAQCEAARGVDCRDPRTLQRLREEAVPKSAQERREERRRLDEEDAKRRSNAR